MKNKCIGLVIAAIGLAILCFAVSITAFTVMYNVLCEMNPDSGIDFGVLLFSGLSNLIFWNLFDNYSHRIKF